MGLDATVHVPRSEDSFVGLIMSFNLHVGSEDLPWVTGLLIKCPFAQGPLSSHFFFSCLSSFLFHSLSLSL